MLSAGKKNLSKRQLTSQRRPRIPSVWFYAENDSYFGPELAKRLAGVWNDNGGFADLKVLPPYGREGHVLPEDRAGWDLWGESADRFLAALEGQGDGRLLLRETAPESPERPHFIKTSQ